MDKSTIRAYGKILAHFRFNQPCAFPEEFAQKRFLKKMEIPDPTAKERLATKCWEDFISHDGSLPNLFRPSGRWYRVREHLHRVLANFKLGEVELTNGSEFYPTMGENSIEAKLSSSKWSVTRDCADRALQMVRSHSGLTRAFKQRYKRAVGSNFRTFERELWKRSAVLGSEKKRTDWIWLAKSEVVFSYVNGSRFSTVRKNNEKRRPINVEALLNMLVQRRIGNGLRTLLKEEFGQDLDVLADIHGIRIANPCEATIDLKNASDSILVILCKFLFPKWFFRLLMESRSHYVLGPDESFYELKKISAMGNGFTFELMTIILTSLVRSYDPDGSVFGDDIITKNEHARSLIRDLESVGFIVNTDKSFIDSVFRESCGSNYHDDYGYVKSFDFEYPTSIMDCANLYGKCALLAQEYPSFEVLRALLLRATPPALRGGYLPQWIYTNGVPSVDLPPYFPCGSGTKIDDESTSWLQESLHLTDGIVRFVGWEWRPELRSKTRYDIRQNHHWAKYLMYLSAGMVTDDVIRGAGTWCKVSFISDGRSLWRRTHVKEAHKAWITYTSG